MFFESINVHYYAMKSEVAWFSHTFNKYCNSYIKHSTYVGSENISSKLSGEVKIMILGYEEEYYRLISLTFTIVQYVMTAPTGAARANINRWRRILFLSRPSCKRKVTRPKAAGACQQRWSTVCKRKQIKNKWINKKHLRQTDMLLLTPNSVHALDIFLILDSGPILRNILKYRNLS